MSFWYSSNKDSEFKLSCFVIAAVAGIFAIYSAVNVDIMDTIIGTSLLLVVLIIRTVYFVRYDD